MKVIKRLFRRRYTQWLPFGNFNFSQYDYITFVKRSLKTNMLKFKTVRVNRNFVAANCVDHFIPSSLIDTQKAWDEITNQEKPIK